MKFIFKHQKLGIKNSLYAIIRNVSIEQDHLELERVKYKALKLALGYSDGFLADNEVTLGYKEILKRFNRKDLIPAGQNLVGLIRQKAKFPTINTAVDSYNIAVVKSFLAIGAHDLDKLIGDVIFDYAEQGEKIPAVNVKNEFLVNKGDYVYRDQEKILAWLDVKDTDLAKITKKTKNILLMVEGTAKTTQNYIFQYLKEACELVIRFCGGNYEIVKLISGEVLEKKIRSRKKVEEKKIVVKIEPSKLITHLPDWLPEMQLKELLWQAWEKVARQLGVDKNLIKKEEIRLNHPVADAHGDFATSIALVLAKELKTKPYDLAKKILAVLEKKKGSLIEKIEIAGPGFINFYLKPSYLVNQAKLILDKGYFKKVRKIGKGKTMVIDYSAPNIAKPFGIGHLRSTNIGQTVYNLYSFLGWKTIGDNHLGDWGTQFGKLIVAIKKWWKKDLSELTIEELEKLYVKFHVQAKKDNTLEDEGRAWFKKLEEGNKKAKKIWQFCVDISLKEFDRVYKILNIKIDYAYGEAFYHFGGWMEKVREDLKKKKLLKESQGALIVDIPEMKVPGMLVKSDGGTTYLLRDLATIFFRMEKWSPDLVIYEVGADQKFHFQQLFAVSQKVGYLPKEKLVHIPHGLIRWKHGKFSTRKGDTIHLEKIIDESIIRARKIVEKSQTSKDLSEKEKEKIAKAVGVGGLKFNDLKQEPEKDIIFDWDKVLSLVGYSAPYLQYTYTRCASVISKSQISISRQFPNPNFQMKDGEMNNEEIALLRTFYQFPEIILVAANNFAPHLLAQYLFDLTQKFNLFYQKHRILNLKVNPLAGGRLLLTAVTANILKMGLEILGIEVLERM